jgi:hypothetical protein
MAVRVASRCHDDTNSSIQTGTMRQTVNSTLHLTRTRRFLSGRQRPGGQETSIPQSTLETEANFDGTGSVVQRQYHSEV